MQISNFLNAIQKEIGGKVFTIYKTLKLPEAGEVEVIEMYDSDGQETGELDEVRVYFKGDSSVGEGDLEFMSFDPKGVFKKLADYDEMNSDLGLDEIKKGILNHIHFLIKGTVV